jgi:aryl-alcohol dehydrogenase-like predicted oxidoreductase
MRYKVLGKSGLRVSELCLGTMTFGEEWGWGANASESRQQFELFAEAGGNFVDTADGYTNGTSERWVGEFVRPDRSRWVVATKYSFNQRAGDPNAGGNHRKKMIQALEGSLKRLGTDFIDLYWVHAWDGLSPVEEVVRALDDVVRAGKVLHLGISDTPAWIVARGNTLAECFGWSPFVALQIEYSLAERTPERELLPMARSMDLAVTPWSPLGGGLLTGKYNTPKAGEPKRLDTFNQSAITPRRLEIAEAVVRIAAELGRTPAQVALAWLRTQPGTIVPIVGARNAAQLRDSLASLDLALSPEHLARLDEVSRIDLGFPHDFLRHPRVRDRLYGGLRDQIDT